MRNFKRIKLSNGLRMLLVPQPHSLATTVAVLVAAGSKYETKDINGISHFFEHMCFKGTTKRPSSIEISGELDSLGAHYNAFTSQEFTSYFAKVRNEAADKILEIVADLYLNQIFDSKEIEKEKGVIIEEINMYEDLPPRKINDLFMELVYGDQPAGWSVAGKKKIIQRLKKEDFILYRKNHYLPQATVVVIAGGFKETKIINQAKRLFLRLENGRKSQKVKVKEIQKKPQELVSFKDSDQTHLILGFRAFSIFNSRRFTLQVLADILGGGMSSRLFQKIREELGAAYYVNASSDLYSDHGLITMAAGIDHHKVEVVIKTAIDEFRNLKERMVDQKELNKAKDHIIGNLFLSVEGSDDLAFFYGGQEIIGLPTNSPQKIAKEIKSVTARDIYRLAQQIFKPNRLNLALIGPFKKKGFLNKVSLLE